MSQGIQQLTDHWKAYPGTGMPYTSVNGHMFSFLTSTVKLAPRLPTQERETFLSKYKTRLCEHHGTILKEYVEVPDTLLKNTRELKKYFDLSLFVREPQTEGHEEEQEANEKVTT